MDGVIIAFPIRNPDEFREDIIRSKAILEDIGGQAVLGYRAPSFSIGRHNQWALDVLEEAGYRYSSSIYPVRHDHYGMPDAPRFAYYPRGSEGLLELPITTMRLFSKTFPREAAAISGFGPIRFRDGFSKG